MSYHNTRFNDDLRRKIVWKEFVSYLEKKFQFGDSVLDLGCGYGDFINQVSAKHKFAIDASAEIFPYLNPDVRFTQAALPCIFPMKDGRIDSVFTSNLLEHLNHQEIETTIYEAHRVLKTGGLFFAFGPNYQRTYKHYFDDYTHLTAISHISMADWLRAHNFEIIFLHKGIMPFSIKDSKLPISSWLVRLWLWSPFKPGGAQMLVVGRKK